MAAAKKTETKALVIPESASVPDYLKGFKGQTGLEDFTREDFKIPRLKLLQALSPEVTKERVGTPGEFWVTSTKESLGSEFEFIVAIANRRVSLWAPRSAGGGMLASARDGIHWDKPNHEFAVDIKNVGRVVYKTRNTVQESGLLNWGSSNPDDQNSAPAATLSYDYLVYLLPDGQFSPIVLSLYRTGVNTARDFLSMLAATRRPIQAIKVRATAKHETRAEGDFYMWQFRLAGLASGEQFEVVRSIANDYKDFVAEEDAPEPTGLDVSNVTDI